MMMPNIRKATQVQRYKLGPFDAVLLHEIESIGKVEYLYILTVSFEDEPALFITAEVNALAEEYGGGSHFLCVFDSDGHSNHGTPAGITDLAVFTDLSVSLAEELLGVG